MNDEELRHIYVASRRAPPPPGERPALEELQQLVEGALPGSEREAMLDRVLADPASTRELAMMHAVASARPRQRSWTSSRWLGLAAAAAVVLAVTPFLRNSRDAEPVFRASEGGTSLIRIIAPAEGQPLVAGAQLSWHPVADADRYVVEVVASNGDALASLTTPDTTLVFPDSIPAARVRDAAGWMLVAHLRDGGQRQSAMRITNTRTP
ncbi:MAG: hypothetical protein ABIY52_17310 [Gemmatimonadaceae bacterium]